MNKCERSVRAYCTGGMKTRRELRNEQKEGCMFVICEIYCNAKNKFRLQCGSYTWLDWADILANSISAAAELDT